MSSSSRRSSACDFSKERGNFGLRLPAPVSGPARAGRRKRASPGLRRLKIEQFLIVVLGLVEFSRFAVQACQLRERIAVNWILPKSFFGLRPQPVQRWQESDLVARLADGRNSARRCEWNQVAEWGRLGHK